MQIFVYMRYMTSNPHLLGVTTTQTPSPASQPLTATPQPCHTQQFTYTQTSAPTPTKEQHFVQTTQQAPTTAFTQIWTQTTIIQTIQVHQTQQARGALPTNSACHVEKQISTRPFYSHTTYREQMAMAPIRHLTSDKTQASTTPLNRAAICTVSSHGQTADVAGPSQFSLWTCRQQTTTYPTTKTSHLYTTTTQSHTTTTHTSTT